ncbi:YceG family protein [Lysinibacillus fusiformis]|uniref:YceG family protein n=1 Tax=Lysinibacillus fusiformis TaxID=28031 RepID=UPI0023A98D8B|nr:YceG family protein [Lysinibacillus fusiformis]WEA38730.1 YceG family protein [Lysinibacillus fusiformis]
MQTITIKSIVERNPDDWLQAFQDSPKNRAFYEETPQQISFSRIALRVLGVPIEEDEYFNSLFTLSQNQNIHILSEELNKHIEQKDFQAIQQILSQHQQTPKGLTINRLVAMMYGYQLIPKHDDGTMNRHLQLTTIKVIELFQHQQSLGLLSNEFRRFLIDLVKWLKNHWIQWAKALKPTDDFPKVVWYGEATVSQRYFLLLLMELGCDVLIFHPAKVDEFAEVDPTDTFSVSYSYTSQTTLQPFPDKPRDRQATVGYRSSQHFEQLMHDQQSGVYRPWQFKDFMPRSLTLRMTYDDIFIYAKEKALVRPQFDINGNEVVIPVIFAKISGVSSQREEYWHLMHQLLINPQTIFVQEFPFTKTSKANFHFHYKHCLVNGELSVERIIQSDWWQYGELSLELQQAIAHTIKTSCEQPMLKQQPNETLYDLQLFLFKQLTMIPQEILRLLQSFDYSQEIPKIVLYQAPQQPALSREDIALLAFLNRFGMDIVFYNPTGQLDLEKHLQEDTYDVQRLEHMLFDLPYEEPQQQKTAPDKIIKKLFNRFF